MAIEATTFSGYGGLRQTDLPRRKPAKDRVLEVNQLSERYLEDFAVGQTFSSGRLRIEGERIVAFAAEFDPQPFHLDEAAARQSFFGELADGMEIPAELASFKFARQKSKLAGTIRGSYFVIKNEY